ncbi:MAG TPA: ChrR family anti-sigma-E factor [Aliidongia sp.]|nr:ChrR family anti-sigma-E factor [Aliidongia sp.]
MSLPRHHPDHEHLLDYASGALAEPFAALIAAHLTYCPHCRRTVEAFDAIGGSMIEQAIPVALSAGALDRAMAALDRPTVVLPTQNLPVGILPVLPRPVAAYMARSIKPARWRRLLPGFDQIDASPVDGPYRARLMRIQPGHAMPRHTHDGLEMLVVLDGAYHDETGEYGRGDVAIADPTLVHKPIADGKLGCVCFAVCDAPLRLAGPFGRILNLFVRY